MKAFVIDVGRCNGCYGCQFVCKDEHVGNDWAPIAKPQPDAGQFWMRVDEYICGTVPKVRMHYIPNLCMHCDEAPCMAACKVEGAIYKRDDGLVIIDTDACTGCKSCVDACPYGSIYFNEDLNLAQKCTGCAHLLDDDEWEYPRCVDSCPTGAIRFADERELANLIAEAEVLKPEAGTKPRVYYLNIPRQFIAGTVYDPVEKEVVIGATVTATPAAGGAGVAVETDGFGDFWLEGLDVGAYDVSIEADGFSTRVIAAVETETDVNLGDIAVER
jgi:Fe-S-cluster-containing dehydrogenase component